MNEFIGKMERKDHQQAQFVSPKGGHGTPAGVENTGGHEREGREKGRIHIYRANKDIYVQCVQAKC